MKLRSFIPIFALCFLLSCGGDDPDEFMWNDDDASAAQDESGELPDSGNSEDENDQGNNETNDGENSETPDDSEVSDKDDPDTTTGNDADDSDSDNDSDYSVNDEDGTNDDDTDSDSDTGEEELEIVLPYNGDPVDKTIAFNTEIKKIDVLLMVDLSGFMTDAHDNIKANVKSAIIDGIRAKISDSAFGLVTFGTIEQKNPYNLAQAITTDTNQVRNAVDTIEKVTSGSSTYHALALWESATGEENHEQIAFSNSIGETDYSRSFTIPAVDCSEAEGNIGGACFRENSMPVFVMASAKAFLDLTKTYSWTNGGNKMKTKAKAVEAMNAINAKFIGFSLGGTSSTTNPLDDFKYISEQTKSLSTNGGNFNVSTNADNTSLSSQIAEAVKSLTDNIQLSVKLAFKHAGNEYGVENTADFVKSVYPEAGKTVKAGDDASFEITFENKFHENNDCEPHKFHLAIEATGEGLLLDSRNVTIVVPGKEEDCGSL